MNLLIVSATRLEIQPFLSVNKVNWQSESLANCQLDDYIITILISGVGSPATIYSVTKLLAKQQFDAALHVGICGHYGDNLSIGNCVRIESDCFADLGIDDKGTFSTIFQKGFAQENEFPYSKGKLWAPEFSLWENEITALQSVEALTVNTATGSKYRAEELSLHCPCGVETMESAAFMYVSLNDNVPFISIRAVSNRVEARNFASWNIPLAVDNLNLLLMRLLKK